MPKIHLRSALGALALLTLTAAPLRAQLAVELRGGAPVGNHAPAAAGLQLVPGAAFGAALEYRLARAISVYAAATQASFGCEEGLCTGQTVTFTTRGAGAGVRLHPAGLPWLRAGAIYYGTTAATADGRDDAGDPALGYEAGAGVTLPLGQRVRLLPGAFLHTQPGERRTTLVGAEVGVQLVLGPNHAR